MFNLENTKYRVQYTSRFKKEFKKVLKQGKNEDLFLEVLECIANVEMLTEKYRNHSDLFKKRYVVKRIFNNSSNF